MLTIDPGTHYLWFCFRFRVVLNNANRNIHWQVRTVVQLDKGWSSPEETWIVVLVLNTVKAVPQTQTVSTGTRSILTRLGGERKYCARLCVDRAKPGIYRKRLYWFWRIFFIWLGTKSFMVGSFFSSKKYLRVLDSKLVISIKFLLFSKRLHRSRRVLLQWNQLWKLYHMMGEKNNSENSGRAWICRLVYPAPTLSLHKTSRGLLRSLRERTTRWGMRICRQLDIALAAGQCFLVKIVTAIGEQTTLASAKIWFALKSPLGQLQ